MYFALRTGFVLKFLNVIKSELACVVSSNSLEHA